MSSNVNATETKYRLKNWTLRYAAGTYYLVYIKDDGHYVTPNILNDSAALICRCFMEGKTRQECLDVMIKNYAENESLDNSDISDRILADITAMYQKFEAMDSSERIQ